MDINELDKKQLILLTLLITFVVSIGTGIVTVSLMKQMPQTVPQTINNVIQRTIEKVSPSEDSKNNTNNSSNSVVVSDSNSLVSIFRKIPSDATGEEIGGQKTEQIGQGVIVSDVGLILIDADVISQDREYEVELGEKMFGVSVLKNFNNGFAILKIGKEVKAQTEDTTSPGDASAKETE